jgi:Sortase domain
VVPVPAPRVRAIAHVDRAVAWPVAPSPGRAGGAAPVPWAPAILEPWREPAAETARVVAGIGGAVATQRVRASVPPVIVARRAVAPEAMASPDVDDVGAPAEPERHPTRPSGRDAESPSSDDHRASTAGEIDATAVTPTRVRRKQSVVRRAVLLVSLAAVAAFIAATGYLAVTAPRPDSDIGRWGAIGSAPAPQTGPSWNPQATAEAEPSGAAIPQPQGLPTRLLVTAIGIDTPLESLHLGKDGALTPPRDFARAGWYADGTAPGDQGPAVIAGHVDSERGPAVFYRLRELQTGDRIEVVRGRGTIRFTVVSTAWYPKTTFPTGDVYGPTPDRQLRLITCGGVFDHHLQSYKDNLVVYAVAG